MKRKFLILFALLVSTILMANDNKIVADKKERDLICGIQPYKSPQWATEIELSNSKKLHFATVKCMMLFYYKNSMWHDLGVKGKEDMKFLRVQDYKSLKVVDAKKAFYVFGSRVIGPKGDDLIPFKYKADAENFIKENGGTKIVTWKHFKLNLFDYLNL